MGTGFACCVAAIAFVLAGCTAARDGGPVGPSTSVRIPAAVPSPPSPSSSPSGSQLPGAAPPGAVPPVVTHGPRTGNKVALTFDTNMTDAMLHDLDAGKVQSYANVGVIDLLEQRRVPATIFLAGKWVQRYPQVTARLAANPLFELGNHSFAHEGFTPHCYGLGQLPADQMTADVAKAFDVIAAYGGHQTRYFRFPGLCHDRAAMAALAPLGLTVVDGDVVSGDPFATSFQPIVKAVLDKVQPGSIVILHLTEANARFTGAALPLILDGLQQRGLIPASLSDVLAGVRREPVLPRSGARAN
jgi:peptidoglycan/xylan/chitin deacetylase (PgdA/CDA1 family)